MKRLMQSIAAGLMALTVTVCAGCGESSATSGFFSDKNGEITLENSSVGSETSGEMLVAENEQLKVVTELESGKVQLTVTQKDADNSQPSIQYEYEGSGETNYELEPGSYEVKAAVTGKATGKISLEVIAAPAGSDGDTQNPVMNFIGSYQCERCSIDVETDGNEGAKFLVHWGSSATEYTSWTMSGPIDADTLTVNYTDGKKVNVVMNEEKPETEEVVYEDGTGSFTFKADNGTTTLVWNDENEDAGKDMVFEYLGIVD